MCYYTAVRATFMSFLFQLLKNSLQFGLGGLHVPRWGRAFDNIKFSRAATKDEDEGNRVILMVMTLRMMLRIRTILIMGMISMMKTTIATISKSLQLQFSWSQWSWKCLGRSKRIQWSGFGIHSRRRICIISVCGICILHCTEFYISQILQNYSATPIVFQIEMSKYEQTCAKKELLVYWDVVGIWKILMFQFFWS